MAKKKKERTSVIENIAKLNSHKLLVGVQIHTTIWKTGEYPLKAKINIL